MIQKVYNKRILGVFILTIFSFSCTSNLDFNQKIGDLSPFFEVKNIFHSDVFTNSTTLNLSGNPLTYPVDPQTIPFNINTILTDNGIVKYIKKVVFHTTFTNTTNQTFTIIVNFKNTYSSLSQYTTTITVPANATFNKDITFLETDIPNLKSVRTIQFTGSVSLTGVSISAGKLSVSSDATIYL